MGTTNPEKPQYKPKVDIPAQLRNMLSHVYGSKLDVSKNGYWYARVAFRFNYYFSKTKGWVIHDDYRDNVYKTKDFNKAKSTMIWLNYNTPLFCSVAHRYK